MTESKIMKMAELDRQIKALSAELDALKAEARAEAAGQAANYMADGVTVAVSAAGHDSEVFDVEHLKKCAPKEYAELFRKHHKTRSAGKAAVRVLYK